MIFPIFIGIATVLFIVGLFFIVSGASSEDQKAVSISDPDEINKLREPLISRESSEIRPGIKLQEVGAQSQVNQLMEENQRLKKQIREQEDKFAQLQQNVKTLKSENVQRQVQNEENVQSRANDDASNALKEKNELLERQCNESQNQLSEIKTSMDQSNTQKDGLLTKIKNGEDRIAKLQADLAASQASFEEKLKAAHETSRFEFDTSSDKLIKSIEAIEDLKRENKNLQQLNLDLKNDFKKREELNAYLVEKEKTMQYELTKNRAQALGLEKICESFKMQIETMAASATTNN